MSEPRIQYTRSTDGVSIAYAALGEGHPIVFATRVWGDIHVYANVPQFRRYFRELSERGWRVIFYDGRGMGSSQREVGDLGLDARVLDLEAVIDATTLGPVALCGNQSGGPAAIAYAARHPERTSHLLLVNTYDTGSDYFQASPSLRVAKDLIHIVEDQWEFYALALANAFLGFSDIETARNLAATIRAGVSPQAWAIDRRAIEDIDVRDMAAAMSIPTLVAQDRSDSIGDFAMVMSSLTHAFPARASSRQMTSPARPISFCAKASPESERKVVYRGE
jgi:pimeloyl-ACP methyl ester carboxylesterase